MDLQNKILELLKDKKSVFLVGPTDSGKSWFVEKNLLPFLYNNGLSGTYVSNCDKIANLQPEGDFIIIDEVETLQDRQFLENLHPEKRPYYSHEYTAKVQKWNNQLGKINTPSVYIIARNEKLEINNFIENISRTDWNSQVVECLEFKKTDRMNIKSIG